MRRANTFDAHRLLAWALRTVGAEQQRALKKALLKAYFTDGSDVTDAAVLADLAAGVGLDRAGADELLASDDEAQPVRREREPVHGMGINAVPTFIVEGPGMLQGPPRTDKGVRTLPPTSPDLTPRPRSFSS